MLALRSGERPVRCRSIGVAVAAGAVFAITGLAAVVCLFTALWIWISPILGPAVAPLVVGASLGATALLSFAVLRWASNRVAAPRPVAAPGLGFDDLSKLMVSNKTALLLAAALAGLVAAGSVN